MDRIIIKLGTLWREKIRNSKRIKNFVFLSIEIIIEVLFEER